MGNTDTTPKPVVTTSGTMVISVGSQCIRRIETGGSGGSPTQQGCRFWFGIFASQEDAVTMLGRGPLGIMWVVKLM